jgi:hypothetical protein
VSETAVDLQALLRTLVAQQTALLDAQVENARLQRVLVERLVGMPATGQAADTLAVGRTTNVSASLRLQSPPPPPAVPSVQPSTADESLSDRQSPAAQPAIADSQPVASPAPAGTSEQRVASGAMMRAECYYQTHKASDAPTTQAMNLEGLDVLRRIQATGEVAHLVLTFGPHAGEPLGHVAQADPEYVRRLARFAERAEVRAAAARLLDALPSNQPTPARRAAPRSRRRGWREAS